MSQAPMDRLTLWYFDFSGYAEAIRYVLILGGVPFNDRRLKFKDWPHWKTQFPTGKLPCLEVNGIKYAESRAILSYAAQKAGLVPTLPEGITRAEMITGSIYDVTSILVAKAHASEGDNVDKIVADFKSGLAKLETIVKETQDCNGHCVEKSLSYVDALLAAFVTFLREIDLTLHHELTPTVPHIMKTHDLIYQDPRIKHFLLRNPRSCKLTHSRNCWKGEVLTTLLRLAELHFIIEVTETTDSLMPELTLNDTYKLSGLRAIVTWLNLKLPLFSCSSESTCKVWGLVDLVGGLWEQIVAGVDTQEVIDKKLQMIDAMLIREQSIIGTFAGQRFSLADVVSACFYDFITNKARFYEINGEHLTGFRQSNKLLSAASSLDLARWKGCAAVPELYYFDSPGLAEPTRLLFKIAGMEFVDIRFDATTKDQYISISPTSKWPVLKLGDEVYCESTAILKLVAEWTGLTPSTIRGRAVAESIASAWAGLKDIHYKAKAGDMEQGYREEIPKFFDEIERLLEYYQSGAYTVEMRCTWIDVLLVGFMQAILLRIPEDVLINKDRWPHMERIYSSVMSNANVKKYYAELTVSKQ